MELTSGGKGEESNTGSSYGCLGITHELGIKEEETRMASEKLAKSSPGQVQAGKEDGSSNMSSDRLEGTMSAKRLQSIRDMSTYCLTSDAVEDEDFKQTDDRRDGPDVDDTESLDGALFEESFFCIETGDGRVRARVVVRRGRLETACETTWLASPLLGQ